MTIEIWPDGDIEFVEAVIDGIAYVKIITRDSTSGQPVEIGFRLADFVAIADQMEDLARWKIDEAVRKP